MPALRSVCVILNEKSGDHAEGDRRARIAALLDDAGLEAKIIVPDGQRDLEEVARDGLRRSGADILVAAGGDGTIAAVASAAHAEGKPMGVIPQGTFNYFGRTYGISHCFPNGVSHCLPYRLPHSYAYRGAYGDSNGGAHRNTHEGSNIGSHGCTGVFLFENS